MTVSTKYSLDSFRSLCCRTETGQWTPIYRLEHGTNINTERHTGGKNEEGVKITKNVEGKDIPDQRWQEQVPVGNGHGCSPGLGYLIYPKISICLQKDNLVR